MTPVPLELPLRPAEAAELANLIFDQAERKALTDEVRNRLAARAAVLRFSTLTPYFGSLGRDPVHPSAYYLAVDGEQGTPQLLHIALANAPTSSIFHKPLLIGRMRRHNGPEFVINSIPFGPRDYENLDKFAARIDSGFLPRPQGLRAAIAVSGDPEAAFETFRAILKRTGKNLAAIWTPAGADIRDAWHAGLWAVIRAGWRQGYSAGVEITVEAGCLDRAKESIVEAAAFTRFAIDTASLLRQPASGAALEEQFEAAFAGEERRWILDEFVRLFDTGSGVYPLTAPEVRGLAVKFGRCLVANEQLHEYIRQSRSALKMGRSFDFEPMLAGPAPTTQQELLFCLHWLRARGHAAQLAAPNLGGWAGGDAYPTELAAIARHYQAILSVRTAGNPDVLRAIAKAAAGRVNYQVPSVAEAAMVAEGLLG